MKASQLIDEQTRKSNQLSLTRIETMFQDGLVSEFEYLDLLRKYIAHRERLLASPAKHPGGRQADLDYAEANADANSMGQGRG